jgi:hypothetical protein
MDTFGSNELAARIAELRTPKKFPLESLLRIYYTAKKRDVYISDFEGFKLLVAWVAPIDVPPKDSVVRAPSCFITYEIQQIAKILNTTEDVIYSALRKIYP